jgi:DNA-binding transcriptional MerR regulator
MLTALPPEKDYYSIGEASRITGVKPYILRYWEKEFAFLRPVRRTSGHRKFTRKDLDAIRRLRELLYEKKFTVEGAKALLRREARGGSAQISMELGESSAAVQLLKDVRSELEDMVAALRRSDADVE